MFKYHLKCPNTLLKLMLLAPCDFWTQSKLANWKNLSNSIKLLPQNCMAKSKKYHKMKKRPSIPDLHMELLNFLPIGALSISVRPMTCLLAMASYLIMKVQDVEKHLLLEKSLGPWPKLALG